MHCQLCPVSDPIKYRMLFVRCVGLTLYSAAASRRGAFFASIGELRFLRSQASLPLVTPSNFKVLQVEYLLHQQDVLVLAAVKATKGSRDARWVRVQGDAGSTP